MTIVRAPRPERNFYLLDKAISEDKRLSWSARGLLIFLLGKPNHWKVSVPALVNETAGAARSTGRDAVYNLINELIAAGYMQRVKRADGATEYLVCEPNPENTEVGAEPLPEKPDPEKPDPDFQDALVSTEQAVRIEEAASIEALPAIKHPAGKPNGKKRAPIPLQAFIDECKARDEKTMKDDDPIVAWGDKTGVPFDMLNLAWQVFKSRYVDDTDKRQADWRAHFRNAVKGNWYHLWFFDSNGSCLLTTAGEQTRREHGSSAGSAAAGQRVAPRGTFPTQQEQIAAQNEADERAWLGQSAADQMTIDMEQSQ
jgi:hypothetical protein